MFSFKKVQKSFTKTIQRASDFLSTVGPSPIKSFRAAIISGDEEKAILIFQTEGSNGTSLENELAVSLPFPLKAYEDQTPMHLAALHAMEMLLTIFLQKNGNPNALNANAETCLHSLCQDSDQDSKRKRIMELLLQWRRVNENGQEEYLSVNRVDNDGNSPLHYASKNGLIECILLLTAHNAIISIVNKDQMTCCEIAAANEHNQLADMLEIALIFPPLDQDVILYDEEERRYSQQAASIQPIFLCDSATFTFDTLDRWRKNGIECVVAALGLPNTYAERVLDHFNWELERTLEEMLVRKEEILDHLNLNLANYKPVLYVLPQQQQQQQQHEATDIANLDDIFIDVDDQHHQQSQKKSESMMFSRSSPFPPQIIKITDCNISIGACTICGEDLYPTLSPQMLSNKSLPYCEQREIRCPSGHSYCCTCWAHHWTVQINDNGATFLHCMAFKCGEIISADDWAKPVLGDALAEKLKSNLLRRIVDIASRWKWCPSKDCDSMIYLTSPLSSSSSALSSGTAELKSTTPGVPQELPQTAICGNGHSFCLLCNGEAHAPCSCEHWKSWIEKVQREVAETEGQKSENGAVDVASALWVAANTKKCPRCQTPIEKNEGCNHMTCRKCRYEFCWICCQEWDKHSNRTGGYFQCTIYLGNNTSDGDNDRDDDVPRIDLDDDYGSASKEAIRARERAQVMERFINHYTRYRAHSDSLILEQKMHATNLERIRSSLHSSAVGTIPWLQGSASQHPYLPDDDSKSSGYHQTTPRNDSYCSPEEAFDMSLLAGGDWSSETNSPLLFLQRGFRELIKCRQVLKGSFPMSFYMMNEEAPVFSRFRQYDYEAAQRRAYAESRSKVFLDIQSDLEILTETLSDVVARRRLRASANQIARATFMALSRRLEFEAVIKRHYEAYEQDKIAESKESQSNSRNSRTVNRRSGSRLRQEFDDDGLDPSLRTIMESLRDSGLTDDLDPNEIPPLRSALARHSSRSSRSGATRRIPAWRAASTRRRHDSDEEETPYQAMGTAVPTTATLVMSPSPSSTPSTPLLGGSGHASNNNNNNSNSNSASNNNPHTPINTGTTTPQHQTMREILLNAGWTESDLRREGFDATPEGQQPSSTTSSSSPAAATTTTPAPASSSLSSSSTSSQRRPPISSSTSHSRVQTPPNPIPIELFPGDDDEEEMNRAILLSLQERQPTYVNTERPEPNEELVQMLVGMGFARNSSIQALKDYGENIEDAIMYLANRA